MEDFRSYIKARIYFQQVIAKTPDYLKVEEFYQKIKQLEVPPRDKEPLEDLIFDVEDLMLDPKSKKSKDYGVHSPQFYKTNLKLKASSVLYKYQFAKFDDLKIKMKEDLPTLCRSYSHRKDSLPREIKKQFFIDRIIRQNYMIKSFAKSLRIKLSRANAILEKYNFLNSCGEIDPIVVIREQSDEFTFTINPSSSVLEALNREILRLIVKITEGRSVYKYFKSRPREVDRMLDIAIKQTYKYVWQHNKEREFTDVKESGEGCLLLAKKRKCKSRVKTSLTELLKEIDSFSELENPYLKVVAPESMSMNEVHLRSKKAVYLYVLKFSGGSQHAALRILNIQKKEIERFGATKDQMQSLVVSKGREGEVSLALGSVEVTFYSLDNIKEYLEIELARDLTRRALKDPNELKRTSRVLKIAQRRAVETLRAWQEFSQLEKKGALLEVIQSIQSLPRETLEMLTPRNSNLLVYKIERMISSQREDLLKMKEEGE